MQVPIPLHFRNGSWPNGCVQSYVDAAVAVSQHISDIFVESILHALFHHCMHINALYGRLFRLQS